MLIIPEVFEGIDTLSSESPYLEGSRVALAWASAFYRFNKLGNIDVRIIEVDKNITDQDLVSAIKSLLAINIVDSDKTPEENIEKRIFKIDCSAKKSFGNGVKFE